MSRNLEKQEQEQREEAARDHLGPQPGAHHAHHVHQFRHSRSTTVIWTISAIFVLVGIFAIIGALTTPATPGNSTGDGLVGAGIFLAVGLALGAWAWNRKPLTPGADVRYASQPFTRTSAQVSHSAVLTGSTPTAAANAGPTTAAPDDQWSVASTPRSYRGRHHAKDPRKQAAVMGVLFALSIIALVSSIGLSERSSYTQHHGVTVQATVAYYSNHQSCGRSSCSESFAAAVTLATPVKGHASTVVHGNGYFLYDDGDTVSILVDPHDPSYAELPGNALDASGTWIIFLVLTIVLGLLCMAAVFRLFHHYAGILPGRHLPGR